MSQSAPRSAVELETVTNWPVIYAGIAVLAGSTVAVASLVIWSALTSPTPAPAPVPQAVRVREEAPTPVAQRSTTIVHVAPLATPEEGRVSSVRLIAQALAGRVVDRSDWPEPLWEFDQTLILESGRSRRASFPGDGAERAARAAVRHLAQFVVEQ
jgi:hypothetical protein